MLNFTNPMNGYQMNGMMGGYQQPQQVKMPTLQNLLTPQEIADLKQDIFNITIKESDLVKNKCTHKRNNGFAMVPDPMREGYMKCTICGKSFKICDEPLDAVVAKCEEMMNIIETIKVIGVELPENFLREIAKMETVLELMPKVHSVVYKTWVEKYEKATNSPYQNMGAGANQMFNYLVGGGAGMYQAPGYGYQQQQMMQPGFNGMNPYDMQAQQAMYAQQQQMGYQQPQQPMGYQQPMQQGMMGMQYNNGMGQQPNPFTVGGVTTPAYGQPPVQQSQAGQQQQTATQTQAPTGQPAPSYQAPGKGDKPVASKSMQP